MDGFLYATDLAMNLAEKIGKEMESLRDVGDHTKWTINGSVPGKAITVQYITVRPVPKSIIDIFCSFCETHGGIMTISEGGILSARFQA